MDILDGLYSFFSTNDPTTLFLDFFVAVVLAVSIVYLLLELQRVFAEYTKKKAPEAPGKLTPVPAEVKKPAAQEAPKPEKKPVEIPAIDVIKGSLPESMVSLTQKYRLEALTLASHDGLVIASTGMTPEQDAAVYSGLFQELYKVKQDSYYYIESKYVSLYSVESDTSTIIGVAHRKGALAPEEVRAIRDDTLKVVNQFATINKKS